MSFRDLPALNAFLNTLTSIFLVTGFVSIRRKQITAHKVCMVSALVCSIVFLTSYLTYHYVAGATPFPGVGWIRPAYFGLLISHTILAAIVPPLAVVTAMRAFQGAFDRHRRIARWTLPIWLYVSVTGVLVYWLLYHVYPPV
ncbi:MAG TPA: DUF420 domain-containing protein [Bdellovibrionota bacterium]|nr:DUF420 domain-containing protein [Bdellovibrionota bacterium]